jgi:hypothetical protein
LGAPLRKQSQCFADAGPSIEEAVAALFVGKSSRSNMHDGAFLCDAMIDRAGVNVP